MIRPANEAAAFDVVLRVRWILLRDALSTLLTKAGFEVSSHGDAPEFLSALDARQPRLAVVEVGVGEEESGLSILRHVRQRSTQTHIVALTASRDSALLARLTDLGVASVVNSELTKVSSFVETLRLAVAGTESRSSGPNRLRGSLPERSAISPREQEVLACVSAGHDNLKISAVLGICERTVKAHISALYRKLALENRVQLALRGLELGLAAPR